MNQFELVKTVIMASPQLKNNGSLAGNTYADTKGFSRLRIEIITGTMDVAVGSGGAANAIKLEECDTAGGSYSDITGAALADAIADDEDNSIFAIEVDLCKSHKRFIRVNDPVAGDSTGANICVLGRLYGPQNFNGGAAEQGLAELIQV